MAVSVCNQRNSEKVEDVIPAKRLCFGPSASAWIHNVICSARKDAIGLS